MFTFEFENACVSNFLQSTRARIGYCFSHNYIITIVIIISTRNIVVIVYGNNDVYPNLHCRPV
ncbi:hypothetical protein DiNV_CH01M_ORF105 [Drosophila innubila nudivirus]|uniref:Uncharacterized protein n=1 Tax=Drosophila innubila nudivirus TaxID=2057187 RepID=A0A2H4UX95_9VIRU|nr:hypothetical protein DiNV_CH01M_ORF105 [Drosophila innubila nudivirus]ATZ81534.1 hypothetical protein DiNV_CH01M_ORF105 [Drosophila innubila nudivirus]